MERMGLSELHLGDALAVLRTLPSASTHMCCTSPPYYGLRDYGTPGQIGLEATPEVFVAKMVEVFREVRRVLRPDGTLWLNLGDGYGGGKQGGGSVFSNGRTDGTRKGLGLEKTLEGQKHLKERANTGLAHKNLLGMPWRVALALQADGWRLRADIIWHKPNPMPESVRDRPTKSHEYIFLLSKSARYFYDGEAVREAQEQPWRSTGKLENRGDKSARAGVNKGFGLAGVKPRAYNPAGRNLRSVWRISTRSYRGAHFATFPPALPERCIRAGTSAHGCCPTCGAPWLRVVERPQPPGEMRNRGNGAKMDFHTRSCGGGQKIQDWYDKHPASTTGWRQGCKCPPAAPVPCTVLDPFMGSATTLMVANLLGQRGVGIELNEKYLALARKRLRDALGMFAWVEG